MTCVTKRQFQKRVMVAEGEQENDHALTVNFSLPLNPLYDE